MEPPHTALSLLTILCEPKSKFFQFDRAWIFAIRSRQRHMAYWFLWPWIGPSNLMKRCTFAAWILANNNYSTETRNKSRELGKHLIFVQCKNLHPFGMPPDVGAEVFLRVVRPHRDRWYRPVQSIYWRFGLSSISLKMKTERITQCAIVTKSFFFFFSNR